MRSQTVKKLGFCAAGALLLGAAAAAAVTVDEAGLGNVAMFSGSTPNVKIVIGSNSMPSDAVAAANIAAMIGNMAYTSTDISILGKDALSCSSGNATSSPLSPTAIFQVAAPSGINSNVAYQMKTYIGGYLDKDATDDRADAWSGIGQLLPNAMNSNYAGRRITSYESPLAYSGSIVDSSASKSYQESEKYYFYAQPSWDSSTNRVLAKQPKLGYEAVFSDPIPVCTNSTPSSSTCDSQYLTSKDRVTIKLLGQDWVIYGLTNFNSNGLTTGSEQVVLGKESTYNQYMKLDDSVTAVNGYKVILKDISSMPYGNPAQPEAIFEIQDTSGNVVDNAILQVGNEYNNHGVSIKLWEAFVGTSGNAYAKVSILSDKLTLSNGQQISSDNNPWFVNLIEGGSSFGASLSKIQLTDIAESTSGLAAGDSFPILKNPKLMQFTFNGVETPSSTDALTMNFISPQYLPLNYTDQYTKANVVAINSNRANGFQFGGDTANRAYYVIGDATGVKVGEILYNKNGYYAVYDDPVYGASNGTLNYLTYNYGPNTIKVAFNDSAIQVGYPDLTQFAISVPEYTTDSDGVPYAYKIAVGNAATSTPSFTPNGGSNIFGYGAEVNYPLPDNDATIYQSGFMSMRGGTLSGSGNSMRINYPSSIVHAMFTFSNSNTSFGNGTSFSQTLTAPGSILDSNGYTVSLTSLSCGGGTSGGTSNLVGADGLTCSKTSAIAVQPMNTAGSPLVLLDNQANPADTLIIVGGPLVNTLAMQVQPQMNPGDSFVKVIGNKILVAGYDASDTTAAANSLINWLANHRA